MKGKIYKIKSRLLISKCRSFLPLYKRFRKSIKSLKKLRKYVLNSLKYDYTNAMVEGKNNKIKVIKRVSYGYRSFRNFKARIMLMERYKNRVGRTFSSSRVYVIFFVN